MTLTKRIEFQNMEQISRFVKIADSIKGDVLLMRGKYIVDGKSTLGVLALSEGGTGPVTISYQEGEHTQEFLDMLEELSA